MRRDRLQCFIYFFPRHNNIIINLGCARIADSEIDDIISLPMYHSERNLSAVAVYHHRVKHLHRNAFQYPDAVVHCNELIANTRQPI